MKYWIIAVIGVILGVAGCKKESTNGPEKYPDLTIVFSGEYVLFPEIRTDLVPTGNPPMTVISDTMAIYTLKEVTPGDYTLNIIYYIPAAGPQRRAVHYDSIGNICVTGRVAANDSTLTRTGLNSDSLPCFFLTIGEEGNCY